jgi:protein-S-isoprenylcysteine O-methyltransferase Ste14
MIVRVFVLVGTLLWLAPFVVASHGAGPLAAFDKRARVGLLLQVMALVAAGATLSISSTYHPLRIAISALLFVSAFALAQYAVRSLGRQLRIDAAIGSNHQLVRTGPYSLVRHPIYTSMLLLLWAIAAVACPISWAILFTVVFVVGTEIRVRIEDRLLEDHFGEDFLAYRRSTRAYLPFVA